LYNACLKLILNGFVIGFTTNTHPKDWKNHRFLPRKVALINYFTKINFLLSSLFQNQDKAYKIELLIGICLLNCTSLVFF